MKTERKLKERKVWSRDRKSDIKRRDMKINWEEKKQRDKMNTIGKQNRQIWQRHYIDITLERERERYIMWEEREWNV